MADGFGDLSDAIFQVEKSFCDLAEPLRDIAAAFRVFAPPFRDLENSVRGMPRGREVPSHAHPLPPAIPIAEPRPS